jgi:type I restriction-modification system DNA methylase subunit
VRCPREPVAYKSVTTPAGRVVRVLVEMLAPYKGRVFDPCCGSGGMFVSLHADS